MNLLKTISAEELFGPKGQEQKETRPVSPKTYFKNYLPWKTRAGFKLIAELIFLGYLEKDLRRQLEPTGPATSRLTISKDRWLNAIGFMKKMI